MIFTTFLSIFRDFSPEKKRDGFVTAHFYSRKIIKKNKKFLKKHKFLEKIKKVGKSGKISEIPGIFPRGNFPEILPL